MLFWPAETIFFQYLKNSFHWKQFFRNIFQTNTLLQIVATDFLFSGNDILPFTFIWKPLLQLVGDQSLKNILFLLEEIVFFLFFLKRFELAFRSSQGSLNNRNICYLNFLGPVKSYFSRNTSFWLVEMDFWSITHFVLLFGAFFCWWTQFLKLGVSQFYSIFSIPNSGSSFFG